MKKVFGIITVALVVAAGFMGCHRHEQTATDFLTGAKGWVLSKAYSNPPYHLEDGSYASDLMNDGYLKDFESAYILVFNTTGGEIVKPGDVRAPSAEEGYVEETTLGVWKFDNPDHPTAITMHIPFLYQEEPVVCQLLDLAKDDFRIRFKVQDDEDVKKECTFTLTFVPVK